jgi:hypothetical protein
MRATKALDIWVRPTPENARRVWEALVAYGAPTFDLTVEDLQQPGITFQLGMSPYRIDLLTEITAVDFDEAWANRTSADFGGATYPVIGKVELFETNVRRAGRRIWWMRITSIVVRSSDQ